MERRIEAFARLGRVMLRAAGEGTLLSPEEEGLTQKLTTNIPLAQKTNPWFDAENVRRALRGLGSVITQEKLQEWLSHYPETEHHPGGKEVLVIMAGNIPLVGFHDMLSVLITGNRFTGKASSKDGGLHKLTAEILTDIEPAFSPMITFTHGHSTAADAVIATGSDNTARYFDYYYSHLPSIIRHNRNSLAILDNTETDKERNRLSDDIFWYYGLGCRSVSKLLIPEYYDPTTLFAAFHRHNNVLTHPGYQHNLAYYRANYKLSGRPFLDAGNVLLTEDTGLSSPAGVLYYQTYKKEKYIREYLEMMQDHIQCVIGHQRFGTDILPFGKAQQPALWDYADGKDTIKFLTKLLVSPKPDC